MKAVRGADGLGLAILRGMAPDAVAGATFFLVLVTLFFPAFRDMIGDVGRILCGKDIFFDYVFESYTRESLRNGTVPFWNPYLYSGMPHMASNGFLVFNPIMLALRFLSVRQAHFFFIAIHFWIAGFGLYLLCRRLGAGRAASLLGGLGFMLGGSFAPKVYAGHMINISTTAWIPWIMAYAVTSVRSGRWLPHPLLVLSCVMSFLGGFTQVTLYALAALVLFYICCGAYCLLYRLRDVARLTIQSALCGIFFLGLSAFQFFPMRLMVAEAGRSAGLTYGAATKGSLYASHIRTLLFPTERASAETDFKDGLPGGLWEKSPYAGKILLLLLPLALWERRSRQYVLFFMALGGGALVMAAGLNLPFYRLHHMVLPMLRIPGRILPIWCMSVAVCGAVGFHVLLSAVKRSRKERVWILGLVFLGLGVLGAAYLNGDWPQGPEAHLLAPRISEPAWRVLVTAVSLGFLAAMSTRVFRQRVPGDKGWLRFLTALCLMASAADLLAFSRPFMVTSNVPDHGPIKRGLVGLGIGRVFPLCPFPSMETRVPSVDAKLPIYLGRYATVAAILRDEYIPGSVQSPSHLVVGERFPENEDLLGLFNVSHYVECDNGDADGASVVGERLVGGYRIYAGGVPSPRAFWTDHVLELEREEAVKRLRWLSAATEAGRHDVRWPVNVRYAAGVTAVERRLVEKTYALIHPERQEPRTWHYLLTDTSTANIGALILDPRVEDTHNIDRVRMIAVPPVPPPAVRWSVNVRYIEGVSETERRRLEAKYSLRQPEPRELRTWHYVLTDTSTMNIGAILSDPRVEDTHNIDRLNKKIPEQKVSPAESPLVAQAREILALPRPSSVTVTGAVLVKDTPDGRLEVDIEAPSEGMLFMSEVYYPERRVRVDGKPAKLERVNIAFTGVRLPAGSHHVELFYFPRTFYWGLIVGGLAMLLWVFLAKGKFLGLPW